jgi:hypothetical protein
MGWATKYIEQLLQGKQVQFRPRGNSMSGKVTARHDARPDGNGGSSSVREALADRSGEL